MSGPSMSPTAKAAMLLGVKTLLSLLIFSSIAVYGWIIFIRATDWYRNDPDLKTFIANTTILFPGDVPVLSQIILKGGKNITVPLGRDAVLMSGGNNFPIFVEFGAILVAGACTALLVAIQRASPPAPDSPLAPGTTSLLTLLKAVWIKLRLYANWPLPGRRFWSWFCGGLTPMELLFAAVWAGLAVLYLYYFTVRSFKSVSDRLTPPPAPPKSIPLNATAQRAADNLVSLYFWTRRFSTFGKTSGEALKPLAMVMFFPVSRSSFLKWVMGTDFSSLIKYHRWMSWGALWVTILHSLIYMFMWGADGSFAVELDWELAADNVAGLIATVVFIVMACCSCAWFRKAYYNIFIHVHIIGFCTFTIFCLIHYSGYVYWLAPPLLLYGLDRGFRTWQLSTSWTRLRSSDMHCDGSIVTLRLTMAKAERMRPGQTVYLYAPGLSWLQTHPFSVAGVEEVEVPADAAAGSSTTATAWALILHIKATGGQWTRGLRKLAAAGNRSLLLQVEGPYDTSLATPPASPVVVMIGGGNGVTPLLGLLRSYMGSGPACYNLPAPSTTYLLWTSRTLSELRLLGADLLSVLSPMAISKGQAVTITIDNSDDTTSDISSGEAHAAERGPSGKGTWLHGLLHYTGIEPCDEAPLGSKEDKDAGLVLDLKGDSSVLTMSTYRASLRSSISKLFSFKKLGAAEQDPCCKAPRPLVAHPTSRPLVYIACLVLSVFGAYAGLITAAYCSSYLARTTYEGLLYTKATTAQWFLVAMGSVFPPMGFLAVMSACRAALSWYQARSASSGSSSSSELGAEEGGKPAPVSGEMAVAARPLVVGPGYRLLPPDCSKGDQGISLTRGRPDVKGLLRRVRELHAGECVEIEVLVGGPPAMWDAVVDACCEVGTESHPPGGPSLRPRRVAHQH